jgi:hypothetical protein
LVAVFLVVVRTLFEVFLFGDAFLAAALLAVVRAFVALSQHSGDMETGNLWRWQHWSRRKLSFHGALRPNHLATLPDDGHVEPTPDG